MRSLRHPGVLFLTFAVVVAITAAVELSRLEGGPLNWAIRALALLGYQFIFLAILSSAFLRELVQFFGRPFITIHHLFARAGFLLITLHPLGVAYEQMSLAVLLPRFDSLGLFLALGGRPAWYLIALAILAAFLRQVIGKGWRWIHLLNYVAFFLATAHANLIGANFQDLGPRIASIGMAVVALAVLVRRRIPARAAQRGGR